MVLAERARPKRGRKTTFSWLRVLAALVALVLSASAFGQAAHFLLVPHTICAEHGELLELGEGSEHAAQGRDGEDQGPQIAPPELSVEHDHCQMLARGQREQALPKANRVELLPAAAAEQTTTFVAPGAVPVSLERLALAPKTSPPRS